jgi:DNA polymerase-3 subunit delta
VCPPGSAGAISIGSANNRTMIVLLYGPDEFRRSEALATLRSQIPPDLRDLNMTTLEGRRLKLDTLIAACEAFPFIAEQRLVVINDLLKHQRAGADRDALRAYLERLPPTCLLVFVESEDFDKRNAIFTYLKKAAEVQEFALLEAAELGRWLASHATELGVRLDTTAAQRLVAFVGGETRTLINELHKLAAYVGRGGRISAETVDLLVQDAQEQNLFAFIDELSARRQGPALASVHRLLEDGQAATYILFMIARQLRILIGVKEFAAQRLRPDDIAARLGQKPFVVRKALDQARGFSDAELLRLHDRVLELDHATKTGRMEAETGLELLVAEFAA